MRGPLSLCAPRCTPLHQSTSPRCLVLCAMVCEIARVLKKGLTLRTLELNDEDIVSLPERLGECVALQTLDLSGCTGLASLPDLSSLPALTVYNLPAKLQPWEASGFKAYSVPQDE